MDSLNRNELEALRILWDHGEAKPADIQAHFSWEIENGTLRSVLVNLVEKGHVTRRLQGKAFFYAPHVPKNTLLRTMVKTLADVFARGSQQALVAQLVETGDIKPADLKLIQEAAGEEKGRKRRRKS
jgi:BlaI family penicillinase repressor